MNVFQKIIRGELACNKVHESDDFLCFHDIAPKAKIHVLVITKKDYKDFNAIPSALLSKMQGFIFEVVEKLGIKESGYRLITNTGKDGGQEVPHFHFHILSGLKDL